METRHVMKVTVPSAERRWWNIDQTVGRTIPEVVAQHIIIPQEAIIIITSGTSSEDAMLVGIHTALPVPGKQRKGIN